MKIPSRPDLDYYYTGKNDPMRPGPVFSYKKPMAKRYSFIEEAYKDLRIISGAAYDETLTVVPIKCR
jgi:hypothetical protein